jgi:hypothetical protein
MNELDEPIVDPLLDGALEQLAARKAARAAAVAPTFADLLAKSRSGRIRAQHRLSTVVALGVVVLAGALVALVLGGLRSHPIVGASPSQSPSAAEVAASARPLEVPTLAADGRCPVTPVGLTLSGGLGAFQGSGPVRVDNLNDVPINELPLQAGWRSQKVFWAVDARESGPILVRVARLDGQGGIGLGPSFASALLLSTESIPLYPAVGSEPPFALERVFVDAVSFREPGCYFMQMDGPATTSSIVFRALGSPASSPIPSADALAALRRPLHLPTLPTGAPCPISPATAVAGLGALSGPGPVYPMTTAVDGVVFFDPPSTPNPSGVLVSWIAAPGFRGPVLIRGGSLRDGEPLRFGPASLPELAITPTDIPTQIGPPGWVTLEDDLTVIPDAGCYAYQLDGLTFSAVITFATQPAADLAGVLRRPLNLPKLAPGASCPATPPRQIVDWSGDAIGRGPVYSVGYDPTGNIRWAGSLADGGWYYVKILWLETPGTGPILVRGRQLDGSNQVGFGPDLVPVPELVLEPSDAVGVSNETPGWFSYVAYTRVRAAGCYAYQVDTALGSETIGFEAGP